MHSDLRCKDRHGQHWVQLQLFGTFQVAAVTGHIAINLRLKWFNLQ